MNEIKKILKKLITTGMRRAIDELGRIVIPKEYRKGKVVDGKTKVSMNVIQDYVILEILDDEVENTCKKFDGLGRIVIDAEIRKKLNWQENDLIEIWNVDQYYILKKVVE